MNGIELGRQLARAVVAAQLQEAVERAYIRLTLIDLAATVVGGPVTVQHTGLYTGGIAGAAKP